MASVRTQKLTREQIAAVVGNNPRAIKLFESLVLDVSETLPASIDEVQLSTLFSLHGADGSKGASNHAVELSVEIQTLVSAFQRQASELRMMRDELDGLRVELHEIRSHHGSALFRLQSSVSDALTLTTGV